jgi:DNA-directed RNA polymerase specialized sigma subunit
MDWKREAVDKLKCYEARKSSITRAEEELQRLTMEISRIRSATSDSTPVSGGTSTREDALINNIAKRDELKLARKISRIWVDQVDGAFSLLDEQERQILDYFFVHRQKGNVDRLCEILGVERTRVYERKDDALRHFTIALYGLTEL